VNAVRPTHATPVRPMARAAACCAWSGVQVREGRPAGVRKHVGFTSTDATRIDPGKLGVRAP